jgi:hypothetical protein
VSGTNSGIAESKEQITDVNILVALTSGIFSFSLPCLGKLSGGDFMRWKWFLLTVAFFCTTTVWAGEALSPYTGQEKREIKSLSKKEVDGYLSGDGMGFAKAAELNHYPGPRHVLDLADKLRLSADQRRRTQAIFGEMKSRAVSFGKQLVEKEQRLDLRFAEGTISDAELEELVTEISVIHAKLRAVHLRAHLAQKLVLTQDQIRIYDGLRGYQQPTTDDPHAGH